MIMPRIFPATYGCSSSFNNVHTAKLNDQRRPWENLEEEFILHQLLLAKHPRAPQSNKRLLLNSNDWWSLFQHLFLLQSHHGVYDTHVKKNTTPFVHHQVVSVVCISWVNNNNFPYKTGSCFIFTSFFSSSYIGHLYKSVSVFKSFKTIL